MITQNLRSYSSVSDPG